MFLSVMQMQLIVKHYRWDSLTVAETALGLQYSLRVVHCARNSSELG